MDKWTDPDSAYYFSLVLLQQPTQALLCPMPFMTVTTKDCPEHWISDQHMVRFASYTKATQKPKEAVEQTQSLAVLRLTVFISLRPCSLLSQTSSCELAVAPALLGLVRVAHSLPAALQHASLAVMDKLPCSPGWINCPAHHGADPCTPWPPVQLLHTWGVESSAVEHGPWPAPALLPCFFCSYWPCLKLC